MSELDLFMHTKGTKELGFYMGVSYKVELREVYIMAKPWTKMQLYNLLMPT